MPTHTPKDSVPEFANPEGMPDGYVKPDETLTDRLLGGLIDVTDVAQMIVDEAYGPLRIFCEIPEKYSHCTLGHEPGDVEGFTLEQIDELVASPPGTIIDPHNAHLEAITLFEMMLEGHPLVCDEKDPFQPKLGAYLYGIPGTGKTHIFAAFASRMKSVLEAHISGYRSKILQFVHQEYRAFQFAQAKMSNPDVQKKIYVISGDDDGELSERLAPEERFRVKYEQFRTALRQLKYQPSDLLYLGFDPFYELYVSSGQSEEVLQALINAKVVFIDDVHPKGELRRAQLAQHIIERRYDRGGGTFITTNLEAKQIGGDDDKISQRLFSRCQEMFYTIDFSECRDWRTEVAKKRMNLVQAEVRSRFEWKGEKEE